MNYIERALKRSDALWRAQEKALRGSSDSLRVPSDDASESAQNDAVQREVKTQMSETSHNKTAEGGGDMQEKAEEYASCFDRAENAQASRSRLARKLLGADEADRPRSAQELPLRRAGTAETSSASAARTEMLPRQEDGVRYLAQMLQSVSTAGLAGTKETSDVAVSEIVREGLDAQTLSRGLERDARRYDGGFLLY